MLAATAATLAAVGLGADGAQAQKPQARATSYLGTQLAASDAPWAVTFTLLDKHDRDLPKTKAGYTSACSAVVIGPRLALTATHCIDSGDMGHAAVRVGTADLTRSPGRLVRTAHFWSSLLHVRGDLQYGRDIALIQTTKPLGVPALPIATTRPAPGEMVSSFGFGDALKLGRDSNGGPLRRLDETLDPTCLNGVLTDPISICTVAPNGGGIRSGDSGGPLVVWRGGAPQLVGIASGNDTATGRLNVFANVVAQRSFIATPPVSTLVPVVVREARIIGDARPGGRVRCESGYAPKPDRLHYRWWIGSKIGKNAPVYDPKTGAKRIVHLGRPADSQRQAFRIPRSAGGKRLECDPSAGDGGSFIIGATPAVIRKLPRTR